MLSEVTLSSERLETPFEAADEGLLPCMRSHVCLQIATLSELLATSWTSVRLLSSLG